MVRLEEERAMPGHAPTTTLIGVHANARMWITGVSEVSKKYSVRMGGALC